MKTENNISLLDDAKEIDDIKQLVNMVTWKIIQELVIVLLKCLMILSSY